MQVRWTKAAADDLQAIADYLFEKTPENAARLIREICSAAFALKNFPNRGRPGKKQGTRQLVVPSLPYIVVYRLPAMFCTLCVFSTAHKNGQAERGVLHRLD